MELFPSDKYGTLWSYFEEYLMSFLGLFFGAKGGSVLDLKVAIFWSSIGECLGAIYNWVIYFSPLFTHFWDLKSPFLDPLLHKKSSIISCRKSPINLRFIGLLASNKPSVYWQLRSSSSPINLRFMASSEAATWS